MIENDERFSKGFKSDAEYNMYNGFNWVFLKTMKEAIKEFDDTKNYTPEEVDKLTIKILMQISPIASMSLRYMNEHNELLQNKDKGGDKND